MLSEFHHLSEKIIQLAEMTQSLRRENADLRLQLATLAAENVELGKRMGEASQRVTALLDKMPAPDARKEEAA